MPLSRIASKFGRDLLIIIGGLEDLLKITATIAVCGIVHS